MPENPRIEELRRRVQADPASIAFAGLAEEFRRVGRYDEAIETCRVGLQRHPAYLSARVTLGRALIETGDFDGAREELETVLRSAPENLAAIRGLAQIHERLGHSTEMDPHLAALAHADIPAPPPAVAPPTPPAVERAAAPNFDLDLNFNFAPPRAAEAEPEFPADEAPLAPAPASTPEYEGLGDAFSASPAEPEPAASSTDAFAVTASESVGPEAPAAHDVFDMVASEPLVPDTDAPSSDVFDIASEPVLLEAAIPSPDVFDIAAPEPATFETAAAESDVAEVVASEPDVPAASVPLTTEVPWPAEARRSPDLDLGLTFTLAPPPPPPREPAIDLSFVEQPATAAEASDVDAVQDLPAAFHAAPATEKAFQADVPEDVIALPALEPPPDPDTVATLKRLEGFLAAIQGSRVHEFTGSQVHGSEGQGSSGGR